MCANNVAGLVSASSVNDNNLIVVFLLEDREESERERPFFVVCRDNDPDHDWCHFRIRPSKRLALESVPEYAFVAKGANFYETHPNIPEDFRRLK